MIKKQLVCVFCMSTKVIRHGKTSTGNNRFRCRICGKTWVPDKGESSKPDASYLVEQYFEGKTCRQLVPYYQSSPLRINQKIREFLDGCPNWEEYLDLVAPSHDTKMIYCVGKTFSCQCKEAKSNNMFLAMAIDALSTVVVGYEIGSSDDNEIWNRLFGRMKARGIKSQIFMANGSKHIEEAIIDTFPKSGLRIYYHKAYRDRELNCCLDRFPLNNKLVNDALTAFDTFKNQNFSLYLKKNNEMKLKDYLNLYPELFIKRVKERMDLKSKIRIEGLTSAFQTRFEKFHMLKDDPRPLVNGWIAKWMLDKLDYGFSRLSMYMQLPIHGNFKMFSCGQKPVVLNFAERDDKLVAFAIEIAARTVQLPVFYSRCDMDLEKCNLF